MIYLKEKCAKELSEWKRDNVDVFKRIQKLIQAVAVDPFRGIGKPEPLKYDLGGLWSRRIDRKNRLIYSVQGEDIWIISFKNHYDDR